MFIMKQNCPSLAFCYRRVLLNTKCNVDCPLIFVDCWSGRDSLPLHGPSRFITIIFTANFGGLVTLHRILSELYEHLSLLTSGDPRATIQQMIIKGATSGNLTVAEDTCPQPVPRLRMHSLTLKLTRPYRHQLFSSQYSTSSLSIRHLRFMHF